MVVTNLTIGLVMVIVFLLFIVYAYAQWLLDQRKENKELKWDLNHAEDVLKAKEKTNAALSEKLRIYNKFHTVKNGKALKVNVPMELAAPLNQIMEQFKKLEKVELSDRNEHLIELIEAMASDLTRTNYMKIHGKSDDRDVMSAAAVVSAYVLRFLANYKEEVPSEKV
ncbi:MAG: hypothetical protein ACEQSR_01515 [Candidatus Methylacidiphilales bacterium]